MRFALGSPVLHLINVLLLALHWTVSCTSSLTFVPLSFPLFVRVRRRTRQCRFHHRHVYAAVYLRCFLLTLSAVHDAYLERVTNGTGLIKRQPYLNGIDQLRTRKTPLQPIPSALLGSFGMEHL